MTIDRNILNDYFANIWKPNRFAGQNNPSSPIVIAKNIKKDEWLLDVGCGYNPFKCLVENVIGVDPANDAADYKVCIEDFEYPEPFDVATCLGSINFGDYKDIERQIEKVVSLLKDDSRIYWRLNPGLFDHDNKEQFKISFFPWTFEKLNMYAGYFGFEQRNEQIEQNANSKRLYAEWYR